MTNNIYEQQIREQGREPSGKKAELGEFPQTIHGRHYETREEYLEDLADFLNGL